MGSLYGTLCQISSNSWEEMMGFQIDIGASAEADGIASANTSVSYNKTQAETFARYYVGPFSLDCNPGQP